MSACSASDGQSKTICMRGAFIIELKGRYSSWYVCAVCVARKRGRGHARVGARACRFSFFVRLEERHGRHVHRLDLVREDVLGHVLDDGVHREVHREHGRQQHLLHAERHLHELAVLAPLQALRLDLLLDALEQVVQVLLCLPRLDLQVAERALLRLLLCNAIQRCLLLRTISG